MIGRLRQAGRPRAVLLWTLALIFAVAPVFSVGFAVPSGSFVQTVIHSHDHGDVPHSHHRRSHEHQDASAGTINGVAVDDCAQSGRGADNRLHVHYDASCPSLILPAPVDMLFEERLGAAVDPPPMKIPRGTSPRRLLRPPIA